MDAVSLTVTVTNRAAAPIGDLKPEDFAVREDDEPQKVTSSVLEGAPRCMGSLTKNHAP